MKIFLLLLSICFCTPVCVMNTKVPTKGERVYLKNKHHEKIGPKTPSKLKHIRKDVSFRHKPEWVFNQ